MNVIIGNRDLTPDHYVSEIYRSTDNGDTWQGVDLETQVGRSVNNLAFLAFDPHDSDNVYAVGDHDILKSTDNGVSWSVIVDEPSGYLAAPIAVEPVAPYRVYVGNGVSPDGGKT